MKTINYLIGLVALSMAMFSCSNDYLEHPNNEKTESEQQKKNSVVVMLKSGIVVKMIFSYLNNSWKHWKKEETSCPKNLSLMMKPELL